MVLIDKIAVQIHGSVEDYPQIYLPLEEYNDPDPLEESSAPKIVRYIEARSGQQFQIRLILYKGYELFEADNVSVEFNIDSGVVEDGRVFDVAWKKDSNRVNHPLISDYRGTLKDADVRINGQIKRITFAFGDATFDEDMARASNQKPDEEQGSIEISIRRCVRQGIGEAFIPDLKTNDSLSKKSLAQGVSHTFAIGSATVPLSSPSYKVRYLHGKMGEELKITYRYRSRRTLQMIGCLPEPPQSSPQNSTQQQDENKVEELKLKIEGQDQEIRRLRAIEKSRAKPGPSGSAARIQSSWTNPIDLSSQPDQPTKGAQYIVKRENNRSDDDGEIVIVSERPTKRTKSEYGEVIELD